MKRVLVSIIAVLIAAITVNAKIGDRIERDGISYEIVEVISTYPNKPPYLWALEDTIVGLKICEVTHMPENGVLNIPKALTINNYTYDVGYIGESAFEGRKDLKELNFSSSQCTIYSNAFKDCGEITLNISSVIRDIWPNAFSGTNVVNGLDLSRAMFLCSSSLSGTKTKSCTMGSYLWVLCEDALYDSEIEEIKFVDNECRYPYEVRADFHTHSFNKSKVKEVRFPDRHIGLAYVTFRECINLERLVFSDYPEIWCRFNTLSDERESEYDYYRKPGCIVRLCPNLKEVVSLNPKPTVFKFQSVTVTDISILDDYSNCVLKVPAGSEEAYRADPVWGKFKQIEGFQPGEYSGVEATDIDARTNAAATIKVAVGKNGLSQELPMGNVEIYTVSGVKVMETVHGGGLLKVDLPEGIYLVTIK